jgi:hypothetical protein
MYSIWRYSHKQLSIPCAAEMLPLPGPGMARDEVKAAGDGAAQHTLYTMNKIHGT